MSPNVSPVVLTLPASEAVVAEVVSAWPDAHLVHVFIGPTLVLSMDQAMAEALADALLDVVVVQ